MSSTPRLDYPMGARFQPEEHVLQLAPRHLDELHRACEKLGDSPSRDVHDSFIIWPK
jgi:hydroxyacylglutathione hydrolase